MGKLDKALDEAQAKGWTVVDMKQDWNVIFPFAKKQWPCSRRSGLVRPQRARLRSQPF